MILRTYILTLEPENPLQFSPDEIRRVFNRRILDCIPSHTETSEKFIHRYPAVQCKQVKGELLVIGICQGADLLRQIARESGTLMAGGSTCTIHERDPVIRHEPFGITESERRYEFLTPWLALSQQNAKKFYDLDGKPARDAFMQKILTGHLTTLAKSLDYDLLVPVTCEAKVRFKRERIDRENVMVFLGSFRTNLQVPSYFGIGQSVSAGYGTIREILPAAPATDSPATAK
jgi:hypothetical protein